MAEIDVKSETEQGNGWKFEVELHDGGRTHTYDVTLNWSDYDHWCHGQVAPERVIERVFQFLLEREPATAIMSSFDCAVIRRFFPEVDKTLPNML